MDATTAIIGFIFVCIVLPNIIKDKNQFYAALGVVLFGLILRSIAQMTASLGFMNFVAALSTLMDVAAILLLVMAAGGLRPSELAGDMRNAFEVIRRGEEEKEVIIPLSGQGPKTREQPEPGVGKYEINDAPTTTPPAGGSEEKPKDSGPIPME